MNLSKRKNVIIKMLQENPGMGKTAVMKTIFMLQQVKHMDLDCEFSIYTYGPYNADVMEDIDELVTDGFLSSSAYSYKDYIGYTLSATDAGTKSVASLKDADTVALKEILDFVRGKSAKDLELYSTIIYVEDWYLKNDKTHDVAAIIKKVHELKPHFSEETIQKAHTCLSKKKFLTITD